MKYFLIILSLLSYCDRNEDQVDISKKTTLGESAIFTTVSYIKNEDIVVSGICHREDGTPMGCLLKLSPTGSILWKKDFKILPSLPFQ